MKADKYFSIPVKTMKHREITYVIDHIILSNWWFIVSQTKSTLMQPMCLKTGQFFLDKYREIKTILIIAIDFFGGWYWSGCEISTDRNYDDQSRIREIFAMFSSVFFPLSKLMLDSKNNLSKAQSTTKIRSIEILQENIVDQLFPPEKLTRIHGKK